MLDTALECAESAARLLLDHFGRVRDIRIKESCSSIVTEADLAADQHIRELITARHPEHNLLTEESGFQDRGSSFTWVVDPLDGTSNFASGLPWFGVMVALLESGVATAAVMVLPAEKLVYTAERGEGALRNGQTVQVSGATDLSTVLCAYGMDAGADPEKTARQGRVLGRLAQSVRNVRATNSLLDFGLTIDGRLGGVINFNAMLWDIAAPALILSEAGGMITDLEGQPLRFYLGSDACTRSYAVLGSTPVLHPALLELARV
jgi:myo-inositol-1(or 4)-monophosphatase